MIHKERYRRVKPQKEIVKQNKVETNEGIEKL